LKSFGKINLNGFGSGFFSSPPEGEEEVEEAVVVVVVVEGEVGEGVVGCLNFQTRTTGALSV